MNDSPVTLMLGSEGKLAEATYTAALNVSGGLVKTTRDAVLVAPHAQKGIMPGS